MDQSAILYVVGILFGVLIGFFLSELLNLRIETAYKKIFDDLNTLAVDSIQLSRDLWEMLHDVVKRLEGVVGEDGGGDDVEDGMEVELSLIHI